MVIYFVSIIPTQLVSKKEKTGGREQIKSRSSYTHIVHGPEVLVKLQWDFCSDT